MSSKDTLPGPFGSDLTRVGNTQVAPPRRTTSQAGLLRCRIISGILLLLTSATYLNLRLTISSGSGNVASIPINAEQLLDKCRTLNAKPSVPANFYARKQSDRFEAGTKPTLITVI